MRGPILYGGSTRHSILEAGSLAENAAECGTVHIRRSTEEHHPSQSLYLGTGSIFFCHHYCYSETVLTSGIFGRLELGLNRHSSWLHICSGFTPMSTEQELFHISLLPDHTEGSHTVLFLHGLLSNHLEFADVIPYLSDYHILALDLPRHSQSAEIQPFTLSSAADHVADLIRKKAQRCRAHVVGLSAGGFVAMELAKRHPELVESLFVTGASPFRGWTKWLAERPSMIYYCLASFVKYCPDWLYWSMCSWVGLKRHDDLRKDMKRNFSFGLVTDAYGTILNFTQDDVSGISTRTLAVAGGAQDDVEATREMGRALRRNCPTSKAAVAKGALHAWDLQFPELFARSVRAWMENLALPYGLEELS